MQVFDTLDKSIQHRIQQTLKERNDISDDWKCEDSHIYRSNGIILLLIFRAPRKKC